jgi:L-ribulose-5-phosphate 4-epimerase
VVEHIGSSKVVLLKQYGVFTIGETATAAVKAAVMVEDVAKVVWLALQIGEVMDIDQEAIEKLHERYAHVYGQ